MSAALIHFINKETASKAEFTSSDTWVVPDWVETVVIQMCGGGGGGGGGGASGSPTGGGAGGSGSTPVTTVQTVVPGETLTITVGAAGVAGTTFANGGNGGITTIAATDFTLRTDFGKGGNRDTTGTGTAGPTTDAIPHSLSVCSGGAGGGAGSAGNAGDTTSFNLGGGGGTSPSAGRGGGGGGGASIGKGGAGSAGSDASGINASPGGFGAGGGGSGGGLSVTTGGAGGSGLVRIWYSDPT